jgi:hypothetical protein
MSHADLRGPPDGSAGTARDRDRRLHNGPRSNGKDAHKMARTAGCRLRSHVRIHWAIPSRLERLPGNVVS